MTLAGRILAGAGIIAALVLAAPFALLLGGAYKMMYMPAESMAPTLEVGDRFVARMNAPATLERGDIVIVDAGNGRLYVKRVAGLPGDRIGLREGIVLLNGRPVPQRLMGEDRVAWSVDGSPARRLAEQFPGESSPHQIYDSGPSIGDDFAEEPVAPGHLFLLGDNRDHSADSRFAHANQGLAQVPLTDLRGVPWIFSATSGRHRIGDSASH
ncbi:MAG TPA: signal peptidase I [Allosphingosinicella sp.]|nr:signal peptidase I [Allosphingosinicella sp.]